MCRWEMLLPRKSGGKTQEAFDDKFFDWWARQIPVIEDYPYAGISFLRDPDMLVPPGEECGEIGNIFFEVMLPISPRSKMATITINSLPTILVQYQN
jgi:hypothetical protein